MNFWTPRPKPGRISQIDSSALIDRDVEIGAWTKVGADVRIGSGTKLGNWSEIGDGSTIGQDVQFGSWAKIGRNVTLGTSVQLGSHTIIQDGVTVPQGAVFADGDLVTLSGIIPDRTGGYMMGITGRTFSIGGAFGRFEIPLPADFQPSDGAIEDLHAQFRRKIEDFQWGRSDELEEFRVLAEEKPEPDTLLSF